MKLCEVCHNTEVMAIPLRNEPSTPTVMDNSPSGLLTFFFPTEEGKVCFYCKNFKKGGEHIVNVSQ